MVLGGGGSLASPSLAFKWTGNANMATVGEWTGSGVQATGSAGGRLSVEGGGWKEGERVEGGLMGRQDCTNILSHYPDSFITAVNVRTDSEGQSRRWPHTRDPTRSNPPRQKPQTPPVRSG